MKELSIEQKAQRYDEAVRKAKSKIKNDKDHVLYEDDVIEIFPELKESEDERIRKGLISMCQTLGKEEWIAWLEKQVEQKAEWSKEDERKFDIIYGIIYNSCNAEDASRLIEWLKSLKDRVQPQPRQEWSEEDLNKIENALFGTYAVDVATRLLNKIKSLRPQSQWKPSNEQMDNK